MVVPAGATPFITNNSKPSGGVEKLISKAKSTTMPNQIKSKPKDWAKGKKNGTVSIMMEICSMKVPKTSKTMKMASSI